MKARIISVFIFISFLWSLIALRAAYLQFLPHDKLNALQAKQFQTVVTLPARRGNIYDMNGKELAMSSPAYSLYADPKVIKDKKKAAESVAEITGLTSKEVMSKIKDGSKRFVWIDRILSASGAEQIRNLKIKGLGLVEDWKRVYPNDTLLGPILGFIGKEGQALEGLELHYDKELRGENKKVTTRRDARGRPLIQDGLLFTETPQGKEVKLTVDSDLQYFVEAEMAKTIETYNASGGWAVVLDAKTSAIRAIASLPTYDPNVPNSANSFTRRNRAVTDTFEPGSTFKTFVLAQAIDANIIKPETKIFCENGHFRIGKRVVREAESDHAHAYISVSDILKFSSNIGTSKIAFMMGDKKVKAGLNAFGFGEKSGLDMPGEAKGITNKLPWGDHLLATVSFGQSITVTPLQIANAYAAIANGGVLNKPYMVESITDPETGEVIESKPQEIRRVVSAETAAKMRKMLVRVTGEDGTGIAARVPGYDVGGKTGTAQKIKPAGTGIGYLKGAYVGSFSGFIPANDPKYVIFVGIDYPKKNGYYGSIVAAPLFSKIASYAVRKSGLNPDTLTTENNAPLAKAIKVKAGSAKEEIFTDAPVKIKSEDGESTKEVVKAESNVSTTVPYLKNLTMREVLNMAGQQKLDVKFVGSGKVETSYPESGQPLNDQRQITVILK